MFPGVDRKKVDWFEEKMDRFHLHRFQQATLAQDFCNSLRDSIGFSTWTDFFQKLEQRTTPAEMTSKILSMTSFQRRYLEISSLTTLEELQDERSYDELLREILFESSKFQLLFIPWIFKESYLENDPKEALLKLAYQKGLEHSPPPPPSLVQSYSKDPHFILHSCPVFFIHQKKIFLSLKKSTLFQEWCTLAGTFSKESLDLYSEYLKGYSKNFFTLENMIQGEPQQLFFRMKFTIDRSRVNS